MSHQFRRRGLKIRLAPAVVVASLFVSGIAAPAPRSRATVEGREVSLTSRHQVAPGWIGHVRLPIAANAVGFVWKGATEGEIQVRTRRGSGWGPWIETDGNPDEAPDATSPEWRGTTAAGPVWLGRAARDVQVRIAQGEISDLRLHAIRSEPAAVPKFSTQPASATPDQPGIISREEWGADESWRTLADGCVGTPKYASAVRYSIVHHTATGNDYPPEEAAAVIRAIYYFHTHSRGFCDIAYNFLIDRLGRIYEGRYGGITKPVIGAHAGGFNTGSTGISFLGDHESAPVPAVARAALQRLLAWKLAFHGIDAGAQTLAISAGSTRWPEGTPVVLSTISGHRDVSATACPGDFAYPLLPALRHDVQDEVMSTPPYPLPGWKPGSGPAVLTFDAYGGLHPAGSESGMVHDGFWPHWAIARGAVRDTKGGYVVDGWGGLHAFGGAPPRDTPSYWEGWDIVRGIARGAVDGSGWVLDGWGGLHPYGGAPALPASGYWHGWDIARGIASLPTGTGGYVVDGWGGIHPFGSAPFVSGTGYWPGWDIVRGIALRPNGTSGYVLNAWGGLSPFGGAPSVSASLYRVGEDVARGLVLNSTGDGGWVVDLYGVLWPFGNAGGVTYSMTWIGLDLGRSVVAARPSATPVPSPTPTPSPTPK